MNNLKTNLNNCFFVCLFLDMKNHFEVLANELLHEIFDYLSSNDVIQSFSHLNKRFSRLISQRY